MRIQTAPNPTPPRNLPPAPVPDKPAEQPPTPPPQDQVDLKPKATLGQKVVRSLVPALQAAALGGISAAVNPAVGTLVGGIGGLMTGYHLGAGGGKYVAFKLAEGGAKAGGGGAILGGIGALTVGFGAPIFGTLAGGLGGAVLPHVATPLVAASILGGATFVGRFLGESA